MHAGTDPVLMGCRGGGGGVSAVSLIKVLLRTNVAVLKISVLLEDEPAARNQ